MAAEIKNISTRISFEYDYDLSIKLLNELKEKYDLHKVGDQIIEEESNEETEESALARFKEILDEEP